MSNDLKITQNVGKIIHNVKPSALHCGLNKFPQCNWLTQVIMEIERKFSEKLKLVHNLELYKHNNFMLLVCGFSFGFFITQNYIKNSFEDSLVIF